jgi:hypothetical protein
MNVSASFIYTMLGKPGKVQAELDASPTFALGMPAIAGHGSCKPDSSGADWFQCAQGTIGCPRVHDGRTPHCIACTAATRVALILDLDADAAPPCPFEHDPPVLGVSAHG